MGGVVGWLVGMDWMDGWVDDGSSGGSHFLK